MLDVKTKRDENGELLVERFSPYRRFEHWLAAVCFVLLVLTGFPQKFDGSELGHWIIGVFGGLDNTRFVHRVAGLVFSFQASVHLLSALAGVLTGRMRAALLPIPQDFRDAWNTLRFYMGRAPRRPEMPKFDYRQKFEYMGMVMGGLLMVFSGLALMYPGFVVRWLPGELLLVAKVAHSMEAMLAFLVLIIWHVYGSSLNPDTFPIDKSMFTGYQDLHHLRKLHTREFRLLFPSEDPHKSSRPPPASLPFKEAVDDEPE